MGCNALILAASLPRNRSLFRIIRPSIDVSFRKGLRMGLFRLSRAEIEQAAKEMADHSIKNGQIDEAGITNPMVIGMRFVRFKKTGMFKTSSLCTR